MANDRPRTGSVGEGLNDPDSPASTQPADKPAKPKSRKEVR